MKVRFLVSFLLIISSAQVISTLELNANSTSEGKTLIQSNNGQAREPLGNLYENGSIKDSSRLSHNVKSENKDKPQLSVTIRKGGTGGGHGGGHGGGAGGHGEGGSGHGTGTGGGIPRGGSGNGRTNTGSRLSSFSGTQFWVTKFAILFAVLAWL